MIDEDSAGFLGTVGCPECWSEPAASATWMFFKFFPLCGSRQRNQTTEIQARSPHAIHHSSVIGGPGAQASPRSKCFCFRWFTKLTDGGGHQVAGSSRFRAAGFSRSWLLFLAQAWDVVQCLETASVPDSNSSRIFPHWKIRMHDFVLHPSLSRFQYFSTPTASPTWGTRITASPYWVFWIKEKKKTRTTMSDTTRKITNKVDTAIRFVWDVRQTRFSGVYLLEEVSFNINVNLRSPPPAEMKNKKRKRLWNVPEINVFHFKLEEVTFRWGCISSPWHSKQRVQYVQTPLGVFPISFNLLWFWNATS